MLAENDIFFLLQHENSQLKIKLEVIECAAFVSKFQRKWNKISPEIFGILKYRYRIPTRLLFLTIASHPAHKQIHSNLLSIQIQGQSMNLLILLFGEFSFRSLGFSSTFAYYGSKDGPYETCFLDFEFYSIAPVRSKNQIQAVFISGCNFFAKL